ncbi:MAG: methyltransferase regulatory domain-containing protein [Alphaproteobacteria bacterium]|nr:methyltransferase regulatory domain-containing protein [Alphaproteobacteria bacterium]
MAPAAKNQLAGYVTDVPYVYGFKPMLAPAWLDLVATIGGYRPPVRDGGFGWCDLGCGQGVTGAILAATHPAGSFYGIDAMPAHIEHAARLAAEADASNAAFHLADFESAQRLPLPRFDYIVAHGVYSWVDRPVRAQLRRFIDGHLKSGGLVYISYNALPGWTGDLPFQHLAREMAADLPGDSAARFAAAAALLGKLAEAGAPSLASSYIVDELRKRPDEYRPGYLVHEFMHAGWQPLYVTELRRDLKAIGLVPVGSALLMENFDGWVLGRRARALVAGITDPDRRELVRDFCLHQRFRCDVFARDASRLTPAEQRERLLAASLALARPPAAITYEMATPAGRVQFDNAAARAIIASLMSGIRRLNDIPDGFAAERDLIANMLALCAAGDVRPAETTHTPVGPLNRALQRRLGKAAEIPVIALPCGTALDIDHELLGLMRGGEGAANTGAEWREFLALHGI